MAARGVLTSQDLIETKEVDARKAFGTVPGVCWMSVSCQLAFPAVRVQLGFCLSGANFKDSPLHPRQRPNSWLGLQWCCFPLIYFPDLFSIRLPYTPPDNQNCYTSLCVSHILASVSLFLCTFNFLHVRIPFIFPDSKPNGILFKRASLIFPAGSNLFTLWTPIALYTFLLALHHVLLSITVIYAIHLSS